MLVFYENRTDAIMSENKETLMEEMLKIMGMILGNAVVIIPLFLWNRAESRADHRMALSILDAINKEMKDFHGRLCTIEERKRYE